MFQVKEKMIVSGTNSLLISAIMIVYNEEKYIANTLKQLQWCDEIIVVDSGSTDNTLAICQKYGCKTFTNSFNGYGEQKNFALSKASNDWIISIDADEILLDATIAELKERILQDKGKFSGYKLPFRLVYLNKDFKYGFESKRYFLRIFNKKNGKFNNNKVHEKIELNGEIGNLSNGIMHYSYHTIQQCINKIERYSTISALESFRKKKKKSKLAIVGCVPFHFVKYYLIDVNFMNGLQGFYYSVFGAYYHFLKYTKLMEMWNEKGPVQ